MGSWGRDYPTGESASLKPKLPQVSGTQTQTGTGNADQMWNQGWNAGFNSRGTPYSGSDPNYRSGYGTGWGEYQRRNPSSPGGGGGQSQSQQLGQSQQQQQQPSGPSPEELYQRQIEAQQSQARGDISSGYDQYFGQLDQMLNEGLSGQRTAQEGIAQSQYTQGINQLAPQRQEGLDLLGKQRTQTQEGQARSLRDVSGNIRNAMLAGNVFLGARGAGDSSAANQYSYALNKFGTQQRGDILRQGSDTMKEIGDREAKIQNIFTQETNRLGSERDQKIMQVASWFADSQRQLQSAKAQGQLAKGQDLASISKTMLNQALNQLNLVNTEATNRRSMLEQWALNNAKTVQEARSNLQQAQQFSPRPFGQSQQVGTPQYDAGGNLITYFPGQNQEERRDIFGNLRQWNGKLTTWFGWQSKGTF